MTPPAASSPRGALVAAVVRYSGQRVVLVVGLILVLYYGPRLAGVEIPILPAVLAGLVLQLPMAWLLFPGARSRVTTLLQGRNAGRKAERDRLRAALAGSDDEPEWQS